MSRRLHRPVETRRIVVDITSWYWHCMTGLWIYILYCSRSRREIDR